MHKSTQPLFKASLLAVAVSASLLPAQAVVAQEAKAQLETI